MSAQPRNYIVLTPVHINHWDDLAQQAVPGWRLSVKDLVSGAIVPVFVPDDVFGTEQARTLIEAALEQVRGVHGLTH